MAIPLPAGLCDTIVCFAAFPHFEDQLKALQEMARVAKKGGEVFIAHLMSRDELLKHHGSHSPVAGDTVPQAEDMRRMCRSAGLTDPQITGQTGALFGQGNESLKKEVKMAHQKSQNNPLKLEFSRTFEANPEFVFKALTQPDLIKKWFGPHGYSCPAVDVDLRIGGNYYIEMKPPEGEIIKLGGVYKVVDPPKALEYTWQWDEPDAKETGVKVQFNPSGNCTEVLVEQGEFANAESKEGHEQGWLASFERLQEVLRAEGS